MWRTMQAEPSTSVPYMAHDAVKVLMIVYNFNLISCKQFCDLF